MERREIIMGKHVAAGYGGHVLWKDANFSIHEGEFVAVLGPNGAGKTTLFRLLLGLTKPLQGEIFLFGEKPRRGNRKVGYVPQRHHVDSDMRIEVLEVVRLGSCGGRWGFDLPKEAAHEREKALTALRDVGAEHFAHRPLGSLSGGELQRVFLAQALAGDPDLLLLDEPLANLDIRREGELVQLIKHIVETRSVTVLLIAHNINPLLPVLDRVMYVAATKVAVGNSSDVLNSESLSKLYNAPVEVLRDSRGRIAIIGTEEATHHHE
jgi:zinc/manganese transport system ATP-binding protein